jgi:hypothetical protein
VSERPGRRLCSVVRVLPGLVVAGGRAVHAEWNRGKKGTPNSGGRRTMVTGRGQGGAPPSRPPRRSASLQPYGEQDAPLRSGRGRPRSRRPRGLRGALHPGADRQGSTSTEPQGAVSTGRWELGLRSGAPPTPSATSRPSSSPEAPSWP